MAGSLAKFEIPTIADGGSLAKIAISTSLTSAKLTCCGFRGWQTLGWIFCGCWFPLWSHTVVDRLGEEWCFFGSRGWVLSDGQVRCVDGNPGKYPRGQVSRYVLRVRFLLVHTEELHFSVNKRVLCTIGGQRAVVLLDQQKDNCLFFNGDEWYFAVNTK